MRKRWGSLGILWCSVFLIINLTNLKGGGVNPDSRYALMASLFDTHTLSIDRYSDWTDDWAKTPDGHVYSNKAPGPALIAAPVMMALDGFRSGVFGKDSYELSPRGEQRLKRPSLAAKTFICLIFQMLPFCLLTLLSLELLKRFGASVEAQTFTAIALLFGNTASLFMSSFFGHGFAACTLLAMALALQRRRYEWIGFFFGLTFLSDYGGIFLIPAFAAGLWVLGPSEEGWFKTIKSVSRGAFLPAVLWIVYHTLCFGRPWALPFQYDNPGVVIPGEGDHPIWGMVRFFPDPWVALKLLFSPERGILFTQPWIYPVLALSFFLKPSREMRAWLVFSAIGLFGLLWMNASFGAWHGGGTPGPRYLSMIFPLFAVMGGLVLDGAGKGLRKLLWISLSGAVVFFALAYCGDLSAPHDIPLWSFYWNTLWNGWYRVHLLTLVYVGVILIWALRRSFLYDEISA